LIAVASNPLILQAKQQVEACCTKLQEAKAQKRKRARK